MLVVGLFLAALPTGTVAREFCAADTQSEDYPTVQALRDRGRLISERTGGRYEIRVFHSRQLGEEKETLEQTRAGAIERANVALIGTIVPWADVLAMSSPLSLFEHLQIEHLDKVLDGRIGNQVLASFEPRRQAKAAGGTIIPDFGRKPSETAMAPVHAGTQRDPAASGPIERTRKVE